MRVAFSGSHRVGKSSLIEQVAERLPRYTLIGEPYHLLEEDGYEHADPPSLEDFEAQLERSLEVLEEPDPDVLAYLLTHEDAEEFELDEWLERARDAMQRLELVVFVPIEARDRIPVPAHEDRAQRRAVNAKLHEILVDDSLGFEVEVLICEGDLATRTGLVLSRFDLKA